MSIFGCVIDSVPEEKLAGKRAGKLVAEVPAEKGAEQVVFENGVLGSLGRVNVERRRSQDVGLASHTASLEQRKPPHTGSSHAAEQDNGVELAEGRPGW